MGGAPARVSRPAPAHRLLSPSLPLGLVGIDPGLRYIVDRLAVEVDLGRELVELLRLDLICLRDLVGDWPFVLHSRPGIFPDLAMRLAAIMRLVGIHAPFGIGV